MRAENSRRIEQWEDDFCSENGIIYLSNHRNHGEDSDLPDYRRALRRRRAANKTDTIWNIIFIAACLSVLVVLFLH